MARTVVEEEEVVEVEVEVEVEVGEEGGGGGKIEKGEKGEKKGEVMRNSNKSPRRCSNSRCSNSI
jgi:hypothetical protein